MESDTAAGAAQVADTHEHRAEDGEIRSSNSPANFTHSLGSLACSREAPVSPDVRENKPNILLLADDDEEIQAEPRQGHVSFAPENEAAKAPGRPPTLGRQGTLARRGQSMPAASLPQNIADVLNPPSPGVGPEPFRDTMTPDIQNSPWRGSASQSPPRRFLKAGQPAQLAGGGSARNRWNWVREGVNESVIEDQTANLRQELSRDINNPAVHPLHTAIKKRQKELKGALELDHKVKQALYDKWGHRGGKKHEVMDDLVDLEMYVKAHVQKFIEKIKATLNVHKPAAAEVHEIARFGGDLAVKAGWVLSQRKGLWGSKTVRQHVQLCIDGSFLMRKTEQPNSPVITNLQIKDFLVEEDPDCDCTINLSKHGSTPAAGQATLGRQGSTRRRTVSFKVNDPVSKEAWIQALLARQRIAGHGDADKMNVKTLLSQLKGVRVDDTSSIARATKGLVHDLTRRRTHNILAATGNLSRETSGTSEFACVDEKSAEPSEKNMPAIPTMMSPLPRVVPEEENDGAAGVGLPTEA